MLNFYEMDQLLAQHKGETSYNEGDIAAALKRKAAKEKATLQPTLQEPAAQAAAPAPAAPAAPAEEPAAEPVAATRKRAVRGKKPDPIPGRVLPPEEVEDPGNTANIIPHGSVPDLGAKAGAGLDPREKAGHKYGHKARNAPTSAATNQAGQQFSSRGDARTTLNSMIKSTPTYRFAAQQVLHKYKIPGVPPIGQDFIIVQKPGMVPTAGVAGVSQAEDRSGVPQVVIEDPALLKKIAQETMGAFNTPTEKMTREQSLYQKMATNAIIKHPDGSWEVNPNEAPVLQRAVEFNRHLGEVNKEANFQPINFNQLAMMLGSMATENELGNDELEIQHGVMPDKNKKDQIDNVKALYMLIKTDQEGQYHTFNVEGKLGPSAMITILPPKRDKCFDYSLSNKPVAATRAPGANRAALDQLEGFQDSDEWSNLTTMMEHWGF